MSVIIDVSAICMVLFDVEQSFAHGEYTLHIDACNVQLDMQLPASRPIVGLRVRSVTHEASAYARTPHMKRVHGSPLIMGCSVSHLCIPSRVSIERMRIRMPVVIHGRCCCCAGCLEPPLSSRPMHHSVSVQGMPDEYDVFQALAFWRSRT